MRHCLLYWRMYTKLDFGDHLNAFDFTPDRMIGCWDQFDLNVILSKPNSSKKYDKRSCLLGGRMSTELDFRDQLNALELRPAE